MTNATRQALEKIKQTLHEAGWDAQPQSGINPLRQHVWRIRHAYETLLRKDHFGILEATLVEGMDINNAGARMGLSSEEAGSLLAEALRRLGDFVETCDEQETLPPEGPVRKPTEAR